MKKALKVFLLVVIALAVIVAILPGDDEETTQSSISSTSSSTQEETYDTSNDEQTDLSYEEEKVVSKKEVSDDGEKYKLEGGYMFGDFELYYDQQVYSLYNLKRDPENPEIVSTIYFTDEKLKASIGDGRYSNSYGNISYFDGRYLYTSKFEIIDYKDPKNPKPVYKYGDPKTKDSIKDIAVYGKYLYAVSGDYIPETEEFVYQFRVYDISNKKNPKLISVLEDNTLDIWHQDRGNNLIIYDKYLIRLYRNNENGNSGFFVYSLSNPKKPKLLYKKRTDIVEKIIIPENDKYMYVAEYGGLYIYKNWKSDKIELYKSFKFNATSKDMAKFKDYLLIATNKGIRVIKIEDINNPGAIYDMGFVLGEIKDSFSRIDVYNNYVYTNGNSGLMIFKINDIYNPEIINFWSNKRASMIKTYKNDFIILKEGVYINDTHKRVDMIEIYNIKNNNHKFLYLDKNIGDSIKYFDKNYIWKYNENSKKIEIYDLDKVKNFMPEKIFEFDNENIPFDINVYDNYAYINYKKELEIYDISNIASPVKVAEYKPEFPSKYNQRIKILKFDKNYMYLFKSKKSIYEGDIEIIDISDKRNFKEISELNDNFYIDNRGKGLYIKINQEKNIMYILSRGGIYIYDMSDISNPEKIRTIEDIKNIYDMYITGKYAYIANGGIITLRFDNPKYPIILSTLKIPSNFGIVAVNIDESKKLAYGFSYKGIVVIDISNPGNEKIKYIMPNRIENIRIY